MIQICSLDFLRKKKFDTDVMTVDGRILCSKGDEVTPEIVLKLYFKEIYANQQQIEEEVCAFPKEAEKVLDEAFLNGPIQSSAASTAPEDKEQLTQKNYTSPLGHEEKTKAGPRSVESSIKEDISTKGPKPAGGNLSSAEDISEVGAKAASNNGPTLAEKSIEAARLEAEKEALIKDPPLEFDEAQAQRIVEYSLCMAKFFGFTAAELKELEQVAYYCNFGITELKKSDWTNKDFRKMKAYASYKKLQKEEIVSPKICDMIKFTATSHTSDSNTLGAKIPLDNIVGIASYYEDLISQNHSKEEALLKMLQLGGNHFNIFILHKFIKMMRDKNG